MKKKVFLRPEQKAELASLYMETFEQYPEMAARFNVSTSAVQNVIRAVLDPALRAVRLKERASFQSAGENNSRFGAVISAEQREKHSRAMKGRPQSREHAEKSAKSRTGLKRSQEAIEKQRLRAGKHLLGKKQSPEHVAKSAAARKGLKRSPEAVARTAAAHTGMKRSSETCDLLSQVMMRRMEDGTYVNPYTRTIKGVFLDRLGREQRYDSSWELTRMRELDALELSWDKHHPIWILYVDSTGKQRRYKPDFVVKDPATGETWIEEVKGYETKLDLCKYEAAIPFCAVRGWAFRVLAHAHFVRPKASMLGQTAL